MFQTAEGSRLDRVLGNYLRMVFFVILTGFLLVVTQLYEVLGIIGAIALWMVFQRSRGSVGISPGSYLVARLFDLVEFPRTLIRFLRNLPDLFRKWSVDVYHTGRRIRLNLATVEAVLVLLVLGMSIYMRLYVAVTDPVPKMSDGDTLLAWIKYIDLRYLMHDGVYPQGFFFYMATLGKFAVINTLYILNYTGPLDSVLIVILMFLCLKALTKSTFGALVAVTMYGLLGHHLLSGEWMRQSGSETEEFGFALIFPTVYFLHRFLKDGKRTDFWIAFAGLADTGLIHPLSYLLGIMISTSALVAHIVFRYYEVKTRLVVSVVAGITSGLIALIPYGLAFLYHIQSNQASQQFLQATVSTPSSASPGSGGAVIPFSIPTGFDITAIVCILFLLYIGIRGIVRNEPQVIWLTGGLFGFICYFTYEFGAYLTKSVVLSARMLDLWAIAEAFVIGMGAAALIAEWKNVRRIVWIEGIGAVGLVSAAVIVSPPVPIRPYEVQWSQDVEAYLEINARFRYSGYMIVAPNFEFALVLGDGFHMFTRDFVKRYDPTQPPLTVDGQHHGDTNVASHVFVYYFKHIFEVPKSNGIHAMYLQEYQQERTDRQQFLRWFDAYKKANGEKYKVFFSGKDLEVFEFDIPTPSNSAASSKT